MVGQLCCQDGLCVHENCLVSPRRSTPPDPQPRTADGPRHVPSLPFLQYHASGLIQRGADEEGFYGFLLPDIWQELERVAQKVRPGARVPTAVPMPRVRRRTGQQPLGVMLWQPSASNPPDPP